MGLSERFWEGGAARRTRGLGGRERDCREDCGSGGVVGRGSGAVGRSSGELKEKGGGTICCCRTGWAPLCEQLCGGVGKGGWQRCESAGLG